MQCLFNQQTTKARTVDKKITFNDSTGCEANILNVPGIVQNHVFYFAFNAESARIFSDTTQKFSVKTGINMVGIGQRRVRHMGKFIVQCRCIFQGIIAQWIIHANIQSSAPEMLKARSPCIFAGMTKGVNIAVVYVFPIFK